MIVQENISLAEYTTFRIGGPARYFAVVKDIEELEEAVVFAREKNTKLFALGGGSNILVSDTGIDCLVIKLEITGVDFIEKDPQRGEWEVIAGAGENWDVFVAQTVERGLGGLENLSLIPGTVGAAPVQNIGAYGAEVANTISWVDVYNTETGDLETLGNPECDFAYRNSIFKKPEVKKYIITRVAFKLSSKAKLNTQYKDIQNYITNHDLNKDQLTIKDVRNIVIDIRTNKLPDVTKIGTAGSFFKNPIIEKNLYEKLGEKYTDMPHFQTPDPEKVKVPAAWLLDKLCGFKGYKKGDIGVYQNQALVLVNTGKGTAEEIKALAQQMIDCVKEKTGITLEREVEYVG